MKALIIFLIFIGLVVYATNDLAQAVAGKSIAKHHKELRAI